MKRVGIIIGGESVEHEVSIITGLQIFENIDRNKFEPAIIYIDQQGKWRIGETLTNIATYKDNRFEETMVVVPWCNKGSDSGLALYPDPEAKQSIFGKKRDKFVIDVVIPAVHGTMVEDGSLQGLLDYCRVPYCFSGAKASAVGMDKVLMKKVFESEKLPIVPYRWFYKNDYLSNSTDILKELEVISYPLIVKPANLGSSIGITRATHKEELREAIEVAMYYDKKIIVEKCLESVREINCAVLGYEKDNTVSLCEEPIGWKDFLKFEDKYMGDRMSKTGNHADKRRIPATIPKETTKSIQEMSKKAFESIDGSGVARIDFLYDDREGKLYVNEINTIPGSVAFYLWEPSGISFSSLITKLIDIAEKNYADRAHNVHTYDVDLLKNMAKGVKNKSGR